MIAQRCDLLRTTISQKMTEYSLSDILGYCLLGHYYGILGWHLERNHIQGKEVLWSQMRGEAKEEGNGEF